MSHASTLRDRIHKIHVATNDGSLDRPTINEALDDLTKVADELEGNPADTPEQPKAYKKPDPIDAPFVESAPASSAPATETLQK